MTLTLRQAAGLTGKSKSTLTRAIKAGRLSASRDAEGIYAIDPAELARVFPSNRCKAQAMTRVTTHRMVHHATGTQHRMTRRSCG